MGLNSMDQSKSANAVKSQIEISPNTKEMGPSSAVTFNGLSGGPNGKLARTEKSNERKMTNSIY